MKRRPVLFLLLALCVALHIPGTPSERNGFETLSSPNAITKMLLKCTPLRPRGTGYEDDIIEKPGTYCVLQDFRQQALHGAGHSGPTRGHTLIDLFASDVVIDLQGHTLHTEAVSNGIANSRHIKNITIRNGVIELRGIGTGVQLIHDRDSEFIERRPPSGLIAFEDTKLILENLFIRTDNVGIMLVGNGNIIRNCVIESGGDAAIMMAGPNGRITNNTIVLTDPFLPTGYANEKGTQNPLSRFFEARRTTRAAIELQDATATVISGNRIEVKGKSATRHNIYLTHGSEDVHIERNTFVGSDDAVTLVKGSTATLKNNVFEQRKSWWKF